MEVLSPSKTHTQALEMVSEGEVEENGLESEHEEGEISTEDDDVMVVEGEAKIINSVYLYDNSVTSSYPTTTHLFKDRRTKQALETEVIYDDSGRTAIFTSPKKLPRKASYPRRGEGSRQYPREDPRRRRRDGGKEKRYHKPTEKWVETRRGATDSKGSSLSEESRVHKGKDVRGNQRAKRNRAVTPETSTRSSSSSSCHSCSSLVSSPSFSEEETDTASPSPRKGKGKENRRCGPSSKTHEKSPTREYGCERPPSAKGPTKPSSLRSKHTTTHRRTPSPHSREPPRRASHYPRRRSKQRETGKTSSSQTSHQPHRSHQKPSKPSVRKEHTREKQSKESEPVPNASTGQNWLPRGSLGEMLLNRPKPVTGKQTQTQKQPENTKKDEVEVDLKSSPSSPPTLLSTVKELSTLDQEDDEELQLRLIAIQSSLRLLTDMQRDGQTNDGKEDGGDGDGELELTKPENSTASNDIPELELPSLAFSVKELAKDTTEETSYTPPLKIENGREIAEMQKTLDDVISVSSSPVSDICFENLNLSTNNTYFEGNVEVGGEHGTAVEEGAKREGSDDVVDMEICDSSGEDEAGTVIVHDSQVQDSPLSPYPTQGHGNTDPPSACMDSSLGLDGVGNSGNFQIPVEWAYMVPPPPPPDQPANDIQNISSWCYDQNMYLQSMQVEGGTEKHQQQQQQQPEQQQQQQQQSWVTYNNPLPNPPQPITTTTTTSTSRTLTYPERLTYQQQQELESNQAQPGSSTTNNNLKDVQAEQYQAFMSAVLNQQSSSPPKTTTTYTEGQRNLILVPLNGSHHSGQMPKKTKQQKQRAKKRKVKKQKVVKNPNQVSNDKPSEEAKPLSPLKDEEEEDEDLLRAQLLIDMSRKKEQRLQETKSHTVTTPPLTKQSSMGWEGYEPRATSQNPALTDSMPPALKNVKMVKSLSTRPRSGENSPTHTFRGDVRPGLSDIGGWGLDPKGSKFNLPPHGSSDVKIKFPPIKPVIISLKSDSEDEEEDVKPQTSHAGKDREGTESQEPMSHSIDALLKSMRNANTSMKEAESENPKPASPNPSITKAKSSARVADTTPQAVRHLSRHQQEEYRWLKEQLRKKEMLHQRKIQQQRTNTKPSLPPPPPPPLPPPPLSQSPLTQDNTTQGSPSPSLTEDVAPSPTYSKDAGEGASREVTWKDMKLLQIQVSNDACGSDKDSSCRESDSKSVDTSVDDEDEEMLRRMALQTQKKKTETSEMPHRRVLIGGTKAMDERNKVKDEPKTGEGMKDEWMVLDEVKEDGVELGEEELCVRGDEDTDECGEGLDASDSVESVTRSPIEMQMGEEEVMGSEVSELDTSQSDGTSDGVATNLYKEGLLESGSGNTTQDEETKQESKHRSMSDSKLITDPSIDGDRIKEVIRRIETKARVMQENTNEPAFTQSDSDVTQESIESISNSTPALTKHEQLAVGKEAESNQGDTNSAEPDLSNTQIRPKIQSRTILNPTCGMEGKVTTRTNEKGKGVSERIVITENGSPTKRRIKVVVRPAAKSPKIAAAGGGGKSIAPAGTVTTNAEGVMVKESKEKLTKGHLQLRKLEKEYKEKKNVINEIIKQLSYNLHEVNEEQKQRQSLKESVAEMRNKLKEMETQLENKSAAVQTKMEKIRRVQQQLSVEIQSLSLLEHQGERMGKMVHGSGYSLPKALPASPNSKNKDVHMKKTLASSIKALRQQMRDLTNKRKNSNVSDGANTGQKQHAIHETTNVVKGVNLDTRKSTNVSDLSITTLQQQHALLDTAKVVRPVNVETRKNSTNVSDLSVTPTQHKQQQQQQKQQQTTPQLKTTKLTKTLNAETKNETTVTTKPQVQIGAAVVSKGAMQGKVPSDTTTKSPKTVLVPRRPLVTKRTLSPGGGTSSAKIANVNSANQEERVPVVSSVPSKGEAIAGVVEEKLDEMKALCPHDLLGRCNDSACQYQHLPSQHQRGTVQATQVMQTTQPSTATTNIQGRVVKRVAVGVKTGAKVKVVPVGRGGGRIVPGTVRKVLKPYLQTTPQQQQQVKTLTHPQTDTQPHSQMTPQSQPQRRTADTKPPSQTTPQPQTHTHTADTKPPSQTTPQPQTHTADTKPPSQTTPQPQTQTHTAETKSHSQPNRTDTDKAVKNAIRRTLVSEMTTQKQIDTTKTEPNASKTKQQTRTSEAQTKPTETQDKQAETCNAPESVTPGSTVTPNPSHQDPGTIVAHNTEITESDRIGIEQTEIEAQVAVERRSEEMETGDDQILSKGVRKRSLKAETDSQDQNLSTEQEVDNVTRPDSEICTRDPHIEGEEMATETQAQNRTETSLESEENDQNGLTEAEIDESVSTVSQSKPLSSPDSQPVENRSASQVELVDNKQNDGQANQEVEEGPSEDNQEEGKVRRRSSRVQVKSSPKSNTFPTFNLRSSPRKGQKRKSASDEITLKATANKRRQSTRT